MRHMKIIRLLTLLTVALLFTNPAHAEKRALVIGNAAYDFAPLRNPVHDANDMARVLRSLSFSVTSKTNVTHQQMEDAIRQFGKSLGAGDVALFYFSGHGVQVDGLNYLLPVEADVQDEDEVKYKAVEAGMVLDKLEAAGSQVNILILDACRNNPFARTRSARRGLAPMSVPGGTLIAYATAPGTEAFDGPDRNSPYTKYLLEAIQTPGLQIEDVFKQVRLALMEETGKKQIPWESSSLVGDFYFLPKTVATPTPLLHWMSASEYQQTFDANVEKRYYPKEVYLRYSNGRFELTGVFIPFPSKHFKFVSYTGMSKDDFRRKNAKYTSQGYKLVWEQYIENGAGEFIYQATWTKY